MKILIFLKLKFKKLEMKLYLIWINLASKVLKKLPKFYVRKKISEKIGLPVIGVTYKDSEGIEEAIKHHFPESYESKLVEYSTLGEREKITLHTSHDLYIRNEGCTIAEATQLLNKLTLQGSFPEPLRISQLLANTLLKAKF